MSTLIVNRSESRCGDCGRGADPHELSHDTVLGYGGPYGPGCGVVWDSVASDYVGMHMQEITANMRPDLTWVGDDFVYGPDGRPVIGEDGLAIMRRTD